MNINRVMRTAIAAMVASLVVSLSINMFAQEFPDPVGYVNDFADVLTDGEERILEAILIGYEKQSTIEIVVVTITSLDGETVEEYTNQLAEKWGVGKKLKDNGLMILNSIEDRKWRIEVGYGLEEYMTDAYSKNIGDNYLTPNLKNENYSDAYEQTVEHIIKRFGNLTDEDIVRMEEEDETDSLLIILIIIAVVLIIVFGIIAGSSGGSSNVYGGGFGGYGGGGSSGSSGFGGGSSGGGGASGGY